MFFAAELGGSPFSGPVQLATCMFALNAGFPCPGFGAFTVADAAPNVSNSCRHWRRGRINVRNAEVDTRDQLILKVGLSLDEGILGDPASTTDYAICLFDDVDSVSTLVDTIIIPAGSPWFANGVSGFSYIDPTGTTEGVFKAQIRAGPNSSRAKMQVKARGTNMTLPAPFSAERYLSQNPAVIVQVENGQGGCWWNYFDAFAGPVRNDPLRFKAANK